MLRRIVFSISATVIVIILAGYLAFWLSPVKVANAINYGKSKMLYGIVYGSSGKSVENNNKPSDTFHLRSVNPDVPLDEIMKSKGIKPDDNIWLYVDIQTRTLHLKHGGETLKKYRIAGGSRTDSGDKEKEGDYRTPRGKFYICSKEIYSPSKKYLGSRWMLLSYPGIEVAERGLKNNLINLDTFNRIKKAVEKKKTPPQDTPLGSAIGIHGGAEPKYPKDWTAGCIGMYDQDIEEIFKYIKIGTRVVIE